MFGYCASTMGAGGWIAMTVLWGAVLAAAVWAVTRFFPTDQRPDQPSSAVELLDRRLAAGEIDTEAYRQARDELAGTGRR